MKHIKNALAKLPVNGTSLPWALWTWNRGITRTEIEKQANALISHGFGGIAVRPGRDMDPQYLSAEFFENFRVVLSIAKQRKIGVRIADDLSIVWDKCLDGSVADYCGKRRAYYLTLYLEADGPEVDVTLDPDGEYVAQAVRKPAKNAPNVDVKQVSLPAGGGTFRWKSPSGDWKLLVYQREPAIAPSGCNVPNVLNMKTLQNYMQYSLETLKANIASEFIPGTFEGIITEMPALRPGSNAIYWDEDIAVKYKSRYKREFMPMLPHLFIELPGAERVRAHLHRFVYDLIVERFALPLDGWAKKYRLSQWVLWPEAGIYKPENTVCDTYIPAETTISAMGLQNLDGSLENSAILRAAADVNSNLHRRDTVTVIGRNRIGAGCGPQELKREIDISLLAGQSRIVVDGLYFNTEQRNCYKTPNNTFLRSPDWEPMKLLCQYSTRAQEILSGLMRTREIAVLSPADAIMGAYTPGNPENASNTLAKFRKVLDTINGIGKAFDIVTEDLLVTSMLRMDGSFATADRARKGNYQALVIPCSPFVSRRLFVHLEKMAIRGAKLIFIDEPPIGTFEDGASPPVTVRIQKMTAPRRENIAITPISDLEEALSHVKPEVTLTRESDENAAGICAQTYHGDGGKVHILHNPSDSIERTVMAEMQIEKHFTAIDCATGETIEIEPFDTTKNAVKLRLSFSPLQTIIIAATSTQLANQPTNKWNPFVLPPRSYRIMFKDQWDFEPLSPNVLPLSNWNVRMGLSRESGQLSHFYEATFEAKELPVGNSAFIMSGINFSNAPGQNIEISFNGIRLDGNPASGEGASWSESLAVKLFDKVPRFEIGDKMIKGVNRISIRTTGSAIEQLLLAYPPLVVGEFSIVKGAYGVAIDKPGIMAGHDSWTKYGYPYMSGSARYTQIFEVPNDYDKLVLRFSNASGTVRVNINDVDLGVLHWPPMELDVTEYCNLQRNKLTVDVVNSTDNILRLNGRPSGLRGEVYVDVYRSSIMM
ncbi:MAG: hypothetical protein LBU70_05185 [Chitinispirillales bacterium]|nr:hypothetical protein [Chitinispirillales bacterium]